MWKQGSQSAVQRETVEDCRWLDHATVMPSVMTGETAAMTNNSYVQVSNKLQMVTFSYLLISLSLPMSLIKF